MAILLLLKSLIKTTRVKLATWNAFSSLSTDPLVIRRQILTTYLYVILVLTSLAVLTAYTSVRNQVEKRTVISPRQSVYENLLPKYADSLQCACRNVSTPYGKFTRARPRFHQVCSSDFISQQWIDFVFQVDFTSILPIDVRTSMSAMWQLIRAFCRSSMNATEDALLQFQNASLINSILLTKELLEAEVQAALDLSRRRTAANILQSITLAYEIARVNLFVSGLLTNYMVALVPRKFVTDSGYRETHIYANIYLSLNSTAACSCKSNDSCPLPGSIYLSYTKRRLQVYDLNVIEANETLPGLVVDCVPMQTTLSSSLECFYNRSCLDILLSSYSTTMNMSILHRAFPSRFHSSTKISQLLEGIFLEEMFNETNYSAYYSQCSPSFCNYLHFHGFNLLSVLTIFISLIGGLTSVLRIITPWIVKLIFFVKRRCFDNQSRQDQTEENSSKSEPFGALPSDRHKSNQKKSRTYLSDSSAGSVVSLKISHDDPISKSDRSIFL